MQWQVLKNCLIGFDQFSQYLLDASRWHTGGFDGSTLRKSATTSQQVLILQLRNGFSTDSHGGSGCVVDGQTMLQFI